MAYEFSYTVDQPVAKGSGSAQVEMFVVPHYREVGASDWLPVDGTEKTFYLPAAGVATVNAMSHSTGAQKAAKSRAYITLLLANVNTVLVTNISRTLPGLEQVVINNDAAIAATTGMCNFIEVVMGLTYPVRFAV